VAFKTLDDNEETTSGYVSIGTMHLAKGLEFPSAICFTLPAREREITYSSRVLNRRPNFSMICGCEPPLMPNDRLAGAPIVEGSYQSVHAGCTKDQGLPGILRPRGGQGFDRRGS
jgi:hypothetical protein